MAGDKSFKKPVAVSPCVRVGSCVTAQWEVIHFDRVLAEQLHRNNWVAMSNSGGVVCLCGERVCL